MRDALAFRTSDSTSDFSMQAVPTSTGCLARAGCSISSTTAVYFSLRGPVDDVGVVDADHRQVGRDDDHFQLVDLVELGASVSAVPVMPASFLYIRK